MTNVSFILVLLFKCFYQSWNSHFNCVFIFLNIYYISTRRHKCDLTLSLLKRIWAYAAILNVQYCKWHIQYVLAVCEWTHCTVPESLVCSSLMIWLQCFISDLLNCNKEWLLFINLYLFYLSRKLEKHKKLRIYANCLFNLCFCSVSTRVWANAVASASTLAWGDSWGARTGPQNTSIFIEVIQVEGKQQERCFLFLFFLQCKHVLIRLTTGYPVT